MRDYNPKDKYFGLFPDVVNKEVKDAPLAGSLERTKAFIKSHYLDKAKKSNANQ